KKKHALTTCQPAAEDVGCERESELLGVKCAQAAPQVKCEIPELNLGIALETTGLECGRGRWNSTCSGEMRRDVEDHRWRRQPPGPTLTLMHESVGSKQD